MRKEIRLPALHPRFRPRIDAEGRRPGHLGTAVQIGEDLFEVVSAEKSGREWVYRLEPWREPETIRVCVDWGEEQEREFVASLRLKSKGPKYVPADKITSIGEVLDVVSPVPKVWWERAGGVTYEGEPYILAGSGRERDDFSYHFRKGGEGFPVLDRNLEQVRNRSSDLSYVLAPLWGFLPGRLQTALEFYGRYRPRPYVLLSSGFNLLVALALIGPGLKDISLGIFEIGSLLLFATSVLLIVESVLRIVRLMDKGEITGSLLAFLVKPAYYMAIKDNPVPPS
jgi:hypothetical protein